MSSLKCVGQSLLAVDIFRLVCVQALVILLELNRENVKDLILRLSEMLDLATMMERPAADL